MSRYSIVEHRNTNFIVKDAEDIIRVEEILEDLQAMEARIAELEQKVKTRQYKKPDYTVLDKYLEIKKKEDRLK
jgi:hypothetical protein